MTRFLCTGDLHFGAGQEYGGPDGRLAEQEQVWQQILGLAVEEHCDAVLVAGDIFEGPIPAPEHYRAFGRPLSATLMPVLAILGNGRHDAAMRDATAIEVAQGDTLDVATTPDVFLVDGVSVACLPWAPVTRLVAARNGGDRDAIFAEAAEHLLTIAADLRARIEGPAVLLAHWSVSGAALPTGLPVESMREVILDLAGLEEQGWDAVVLGHIHKPQLSSEQEPGMRARTPAPIFYVGSPMPLDFGEGEFEHGVWILDVGEVTTARFVPVTSRALHTIDFRKVGADPAAQIALADSLGWSVPDGAVVRVCYAATPEQSRRIDQRAIREALVAAGACRVHFRPTPVQEDRARVAAIDESLNDLAAFDLWLDARGVAVGRRGRLRELAGDYLEAVA